MSGVGYGTNTNAPIVEAGLHTIAGRKAPLPHSHSESPYPTTADSLDIHRSVYEGTIAFRDADDKKKAVRGTFEFHSDLSGRFADAGTFDEIKRRVKRVGIIRRDAVQNATSADDLAAIAVRGQISLYNTGGETIRSGDKIRAVVPASDAGIQGFRNNPKDRALCPTNALSSLNGMPRGKVHLQTVAVKPSDHVSVDSVANYSSKSSPAVQAIAKGLDLNDTAVLAGALIEAEIAGVITINETEATRQVARNALGADRRDRTSDAFLNRVRTIRRGIRERDSAFAVDGKSLVKKAQEAKWARARHALHLKRRKFHNDPIRQNVSNEQANQGHAILAHISAGVRLQDDDVIGMAFEDARPGELFQASVDFTR